MNFLYLHCREVGTIHRSVLFHMYLGKSPHRTFVAGRWLNLLTIKCKVDQSDIVYRLLNQAATARGFLLLRPVASLSAPQRPSKLLPKSVGSKAERLFPQKKDFSTVLGSSFNVEKAIQFWFKWHHSSIYANLLSIIWGHSQFSVFRLRLLLLWFLMEACSRCFLLLWSRRLQLLTMDV